MIFLAAALLAAGGVGLIVLARILDRRRRTADLNAMLDAPGAFLDQAVLDRAAETEERFFEPGVMALTTVLDRLNVRERLQAELLRARIPLRPAEFVMLASLGATIGSVAAGLLTGQIAVGALLWPLLLWVGFAFVKSRASARRKAFEAQLPDALSLIASSLEAGHTFLRAAEMMVEESAAPLSEEFERVLSETRLGDPIVESLQRMSDRMELEDLAWVVQAIRIQQSVGGKLADLLHTLADFMRAREEIRREVQVLTAEGRLSARVLGALPVAVFFLIKSMNPDYLQPMMSGSGLVWLIGAGVSVLIGMQIITRMAKVDV